MVQGIYEELTQMQSKSPLLLECGKGLEKNNLL